MMDSKIQRLQDRATSRPLYQPRYNIISIARHILHNIFHNNDHACYKSLKLAGLMDIII